MKKRWLRGFAVGFYLVFSFVLITKAMAGEVPRITKEDLKGMLGKPDVIIFDERTGADWNASEFKISGAVREDPNKVSEWANKYPKDKTLVFYCA